MIDLFLAAQSLPFASALAVVFGLFLLEILSLLLGSTVLGFGGEAPDLDADMDADFDLSSDLEAETPGLSDTDVSSPSGLLGWLGIRDVPFLIWLVCFLTMFGLSGLILQSAIGSIFGAPLPALIASGIALIPATALTRFLTGWVAALMPKTETSAMRKRFLGGHRGVISQGTATRGKPAEAKIKDRFGNTHYLRVEPLYDGDVFPQGSDITLIRKRGDQFFVI
ncbi:YqiJ family protein [uncultured Roseobacter sp.]|uniref:YqiJ family protein n=1 Tax=uncultured Roseobacter sp. TaxID=114847 RepID=UPI00262BD9C6|nr:YqiJ family protein [uncultured Roseobacter sp.]